MAVDIRVGDCLDELAKLDADSIDCVVTSPPYWGLRDYGVDGQIGLETSVPEHIEKLVAVFDAVHRVLKPEGTVWLNYGDAYATSPNGSTHLTHDGRCKSKRDDRTFTDKPFSTIDRSIGLKSKDLIGLPWRLALALQDAGWWLRSDIVWNKPNPMPESVKDRPTRAHEYIFLLSKSARYYYDAQAIRERAEPSSVGEPRSAGNKTHKYVDAV